MGYIVEMWTSYTREHGFCSRPANYGMVWDVSVENRTTRMYWQSITDTAAHSLLISSILITVA